MIITTHDRRKGRNARPFFLYLKPSERERKPILKAKKARQKAGKQARQEAKQESRTRGQERKTKGKRKDFAGLFDKRKGKTRHKPQNRLTTHAHKSPTSHAKHATNTNPHETHKTPLKPP